MAEGADGERFFALLLLDPRNDTQAAVTQDIEAGRFWGFKPCPDYARPDDIARAEVDKMLPAWALEIADAHALVIMLHLPRPGRLADPLNREQVTRLCGRYPRVQVVLAHVGRAYFLKGVESLLGGLLELPNLYFDLAGLLTIPLSVAVEKLAPLFAPEVARYLTPFWNRTGIVFWVCMASCAVVSVLTKPKSDQELAGLIWNCESLRLPETLRHNMRGLRNPALWWAAVTAAVLYFYVRYW